MGRAQARSRNRQDSAPGRWRRRRHLWRDHRARHRRRGEEAEGRHRFPAADLQLPGKILRGRPHSRRLFQARGTAERKRDAGVAPDRPPDPSAVRRRLALRHPGHRDHHVARPGEQPRHPRHGGGVGGADALRRAVHGPDRRRAGRLHQQRIRPQSADRRDDREQSRPRRRRHPGRGADGGVRGQGAARGGHARRRDVRPPPFPAGDRGDHPPRREGREGAARARGGGQCRRSRSRCSASSSRICAPPMRSPTRWRATTRSRPPRPR